MSRRISPDLSGKTGESGLFLRENQLFPAVSPFFPHCTQGAGGYGREVHGGGPKQTQRTKAVRIDATKVGISGQGNIP